MSGPVTTEETGKISIREKQKRDYPRNKRDLKESILIDYVCRTSALFFYKCDLHISEKAENDEECGGVDVFRSIVCSARLHHRSGHGNQLRLRHVEQLRFRRDQHIPYFQEIQINFPSDSVKTAQLHPAYTAEEF